MLRPDFAGFRPEQESGPGFRHLNKPEEKPERNLGSNASDLCFLPSCLLPKMLLIGISTKSPNLQPQKIFNPLEGIFDLLGQKSLPEGQNFQLFGNL